MSEVPNLEGAVRAVPGGVELSVYCQPRAARSGILGAHGGLVKIKVREAPVDGKANEALLALLAGALGVGRDRLSLLSGQQSRMKRVRAEGVGRDAALAAILRAVAAAGRGDR